ncbi:protein arginine methyltransferase 3 [Cladochytrium replicatum]|nr:protein arginine methyltransferase 3 [Cladochytrium replicatum]
MERDEEVNSDIEDGDWDDWDEQDDAVPAKCLFCEKELLPSALIDHMRADHAFDIGVVRKSLALDFYGSIRLINYIRNHSTPASTVSSWTRQSAPAFFDDETYLIPVIPDDSLLYAFGDDDNDDDGPLQQASSTSSSSQPADQRILELERALAESKQKLAEVGDAYTQYRELVHKTFLSDDKEKKVLDLTEDGWDLDGYYGSYAEKDIHETMLKDTVRTESYRDAIYKNKDFFKGKVVLDVGCGTGILSMFAAKAGASKVIAVDNSTIILKARQIAAENGLDKIITFVRGEIENIELPVDKVDVIISEWMGYFLLFEGMLDSVLDARDRYLAPDGLKNHQVCPSRAKVIIAGYDQHDEIAENFAFWDDVYGFKMSSMKQMVLRDAEVEVFEPTNVITDNAVIHDIDIHSATAASLDICGDFILRPRRKGMLSGFLGWFDIEFGPNPTAGSSNDINVVEFSTSPFATPTHWKQALFKLRDMIEVDESTEIIGVFSYQKSKESKRELDVNVSFSVRGVSYSQDFQVR